MKYFFFFSSRRRHTRLQGDWSSDVCSSDLGGATKVLSLPIPPTVGELRKTKAVIVAEIDRLLERCTDSEVAAELNKKGWRSSTNQPFSRWIIYQLRTGHKLASRTE